MSRRTLTIAKAEKALRANNGVVLHAAEACGVTRQTFWRFMAEFPQLYDVKTEAEEDIIDVAEGILLTNIRAGDMKSIRWFLDRKAKNRGYSTRVETTGADGAPIQSDVNHAGFSELSELLDGAARRRAEGIGDAGEVVEPRPAEPTPSD